MKVTANAPENGWLEYDPASFWGVKRPIFRGELLVPGRVSAMFVFEPSL